MLPKKLRGVYGSPRIWSDLAIDDGEQISKRVERLMRKAGLSGLVTKRWKATTIRVRASASRTTCSTATSAADGPKARACLTFFIASFSQL